MNEITNSYCPKVIIINHYSPHSSPLQTPERSEMNEITNSNCPEAVIIIIISSTLQTPERNEMNEILNSNCSKAIIIITSSPLQTPERNERNTELKLPQGNTTTNNNNNSNKLNHCYLYKLTHRRLDAERSPVPFLEAEQPLADLQSGIFGRVDQKGSDPPEPPTINVPAAHRRRCRRCCCCCCSTTGRRRRSRRDDGANVARVGSTSVTWSGTGQRVDRAGRGGWNEAAINAGQSVRSRRGHGGLVGWLVGLAGLWLLLSCQRVLVGQLRWVVLQGLNFGEGRCLICVFMAMVVFGVGRFP